MLAVGLCVNNNHMLSLYLSLNVFSVYKKKLKCDKSQHNLDEIHQSYFIFIVHSAWCSSNNVCIVIWCVYVHWFLEVFHLLK